MWQQSPFRSSSRTEEPRDFRRSQLHGLLSHWPPNLLATLLCCGHRLGQVGRPEGRWREGGEGGDGLLASPGRPRGKSHTFTAASWWAVPDPTDSLPREGPGAPPERWASTWSFSGRNALILCSAIRPKSGAPLYLCASHCPRGPWQRTAENYRQRNCSSFQGDVMTRGKGPKEPLGPLAPPPGLQWEEEELKGRKEKGRKEM